MLLLPTQLDISGAVKGLKPPRWANSVLSIDDCNVLREAISLLSPENVALVGKLLQRPYDALIPTGPAVKLLFLLPP